MQGLCADACPTCVPVACGGQTTHVNKVKTFHRHCYEHGIHRCSSIVHSTVLSVVQLNNLETNVVNLAENTVRLELLLATERLTSDLRKGRRGGEKHVGSKMLLAVY